VQKAGEGLKNTSWAESIGILPNCIPTFLQIRVSNIYKSFMLSDEELVKGCAKGDRAAQRALYDRFCRKMMVICQRYARSTQEAEDSLQEGFVKIFKSIADFRFESKLETWITRVMINASLNSQRQKLYMLPMIDVEDVSIPQREEISLSGFHLAELITFVQSLPDGCRVVFNLFAVEGYSHKEIAEMLKISEGTSKSQYNRARSLLRARLQAEAKYAKLGEGSV
jgi:RNA polymerase sigma factor (sigma-70 family)